MGAFHAYDIRGVYGVDFDGDIVYKTGYFLPELLKTRKVLIGRDARVSSPEIRDFLIKGITDAGADVYDIGLATTPMVYYATAKYGYKASVQITASHNPREYNGMKVSTLNASPVGYNDGLGLIEKWINEGRSVPVVPKTGSVTSVDIRKEYVDFMMKYKCDYSSLNIGMDLSNGMAALVIKDILGEGVKSGERGIHYIFDEMDGTFPNHEANPLVPKNIVSLQKLVAAEKCDVGVIYDGDADRVMFVDEKAEFVSPDLMIALMGDYWLGEKGISGKVLQDIRSSRSVGEYLKPMGAEMVTYKVGRAFAARKLREIDGVYGGELAGHYYFRDFFYSDSGIMASLILLHVIANLKKSGKTLSGKISEIDSYAGSGEMNFRVERKSEAMEAVKDYFLSIEKPLVVMDFDGYRLDFKDWWFNIRPSNTEPYLRFICEAADPELLEEKKNAACRIIEKFGKAEN
ncbi:MAG: phosphomannomutase/phosphoglucomutase [Bacteroidales bacterium]|jgi:phosphomannomutase|nr:phosphomannomutase/phosphoglucomutase [Bacteroidales bacterium]